MPTKPRQCDELVAVRSSVPFNSQRRSIEKRQAAINGLIIDNDGASAHFGNNLSPGCTACKNNRWVAVFVGRSCNANCTFCPQAAKPLYEEDKLDEKIVSTIGTDDFYRLLSRLYKAAEDKLIDAVGYSGGEPLLYIDRIIKYASILMDFPDLYQYIYTNGTLIDETNIGLLSESGIKEVRIDLAATDFSGEVIDKIALCKKHIPFISIEVPALKGISEKIIHNAQRLFDIGVDAINMCEVVINKNNIEFFRNELYYIINPYEGFSVVSFKDRPNNYKDYRRYAPVWSRHEIYNVIEAASINNWPCTINDCSQENHYKEET